MKHTITSVINNALLACAAVITGCAGNERESAPAAVQTPPQVTTAAVQQLQPAYQLLLPGELQPYEQVRLYAKVKGFVKKIYADRGSVVRKGQLLALLEAPEVNEQYLSQRSGEQKLQADYLFSRQVYERLQQAARRNGAVAPVELDRARSRLQSDSAAYAAARATANAAAQLSSYLRITAPFNGIVTAREVSEGALVGGSSATPLFAVAQQHRLRLIVAIPEKHARSLSGNSTADFTVSSQPGQVFHASPSRNSSLLNQQDRSLVVEFDVDNRNGMLSGGDYAQVTLQLQRPAPSLWVPAKSVVRAQSGVFVLKLQQDGTLLRVPVNEGLRKDSLQEVFGDLHRGDNVVREGSEELPEGKKVAVR